ncbi:MAG TPA: sigma-70 family RNA polymerase sigma factor [Verrucomicrobiae bacterium]|nr:sigma-70 family RNA polymerase sigma factor [Verrucomicrobiae bacterium]
MSDESRASIEAELLRQVAQGDQTAFGQLYDRLAGVLFTVVHNILGDHKLAEDVLQDAFLQIWEKAWQFDGRLGSPLSWAVTLARNKAIDYARSTQRRRRLVDQLIENTAGDPLFGVINADEAAGNDEAELIRRLVGQLPAEQRQAIELAFFGGLTQSEISEALKEPLGTVKARIRRGMQKLREFLEDL